jgi:hypothetical protein
MADTRAPTLLAFAVAFAVQATALEAQQSRAAFDTLTIAINAVANVNRNIFHDYWEPRPGLEIQFATPFYLGVGEAGVHYAGFAGRGPEQPDFATLFVYVGWGYEWPIAQRIAWYNGLRAGTLIMVFDLPEELSEEQELGLALNSQLRYRFAGAWALSLAARYRIVFTRERLKYAFLAAGVSRSFGTPRWLWEFLN